jgi:ribosomal RNA-processing protein 7
MASEKKSSAMKSKKSPSKSTRKIDPSKLLIKGYLPIRILFCSEEDVPNPMDETFCYTKEHFGTDQSTLFVANAPFFPGISTRILLRSIFGRFGEIKRVTVVSNPRPASETTSQWLWTSESKWIPSYTTPGLGIDLCEGKFAHVVFSSPKEKSAALSSLMQVMAQKAEKQHKPGIVVGKLEIQTLKDETYRSVVGDNFDGDIDPSKDPSASGTGLFAIAARYRASLERISSRQEGGLLDECNQIMQEYEEAEEASRLAKESAHIPDDDGFVTVTHSSSHIGSKLEFEEGISTTNRRKGSKRRRTKKEALGAAELDDFYRFQQKDTRRKVVQELRKKFEEDLAKVKKLKEERHYRPFA